MITIPTLKELTRMLKYNYSNVLKAKSIIEFCPILHSYGGKDWQQYVQNAQEGYHRTIVTKQPEFQMYVMTWYPFSHTNVHLHSDYGCCFKILKGGLTEKKYLKNGLILHNDIRTNKISYIDNTIGSHQIGNYHEFVSVSLHVYAPPILVLPNVEVATNLSLNTYDKSYLLD